MSLEEVNPDVTPEHSHPTEIFYSVVALILFLVTVAEVALLYPPLNLLNGYLKVGVLVVLSVFKFIAVVMFFMHLYYDSPLCTFLFTLGMLMATGTVVALIHLFPPPKNMVRPTKKREQWVVRPAPLIVVQLPAFDYRLT